MTDASEGSPGPLGAAGTGEVAIVEQEIASARDEWDRVSAAWDQRADELERSTAPVRSALIAALAPTGTDRVLELAGGIGALGRELASLVREVVCTDVAPGMVAAAARRAAEAGLENITCELADAQALRFDRGSFDAVACQFGLMLMPDPGAALAEARRVLRRGGRLAVATWGAPQENLRLLAIGAALLQHGHAVTRDPTGPGGVFSLSDPDVLRSQLEAAGFADVAVATVGLVSTYARFEDYWERNTATGAPLQRALDRLSPEELDAVRETCRRACGHLRTDEGYRFTGQALVASARA